MSPPRRLLVWRRAHDLTRLVLRLPPLASPSCHDVETQLRRAVVTIAARIAEAASHGHAPPFAQHLGVALSAAREASYLILLLSDLDELSTSSHAKLEARVDEIARMLVALIRRHPPRARSQKPSLQPTKARIRLGAESGAGACVSRA